MLTNGLRRLSLICLTTLSLSGCETVRSSTAVRCPPIATYSKEEQAQAAAEREYDELHERDPVTRRMVGDYGRLRAACRGFQQ